MTLFPTETVPPEMRSMPVDVADLLAGIALPAEVFRAKLMLLAAAWRSIPAASLLDDDDGLAAACGLSLKAWLAYRCVITQGWDLKEGRLSHRGLQDGLREAKRAIGRRRSNAQAQMKRRKKRQVSVTAVIMTTEPSQHDTISTSPPAAPQPTNREAASLPSPPSGRRTPC